MVELLPPLLYNSTKSVCFWSLVLQERTFISNIDKYNDVHDVNANMYVKVIHFRKKKYCWSGKILNLIDMFLL